MTLIDPRTNKPYNPLDVTARITQIFLLLTNINLETEENIFAWTYEERLAALNWALRAYIRHVHHSNITVPPRPKWVKLTGKLQFINLLVLIPHHMRVGKTTRLGA